MLHMSSLSSKKNTHMSSLRIKNKISHKLVPENSQGKCIITKNMNIEKSY